MKDNSTIAVEKLVNKATDDAVALLAPPALLCARATIAQLEEIECFLVLYEPNSPDSRPENICVVFSEEAAKKEVERLETLAKPIRELAHECYLYHEMFYESYDSEDYSKSIYDDQVYSSMRDELNDMIRGFDNSCGVFFTPCCISPIDHEWQPKFCYQKIPILRNEPDCNCHNFEYQVCDICQCVAGEETDES